MKKSLYLFILFGLLLSYCSPSTFDRTEAQINLTSASDMLVSGDLIVIAGSTKNSEEEFDIKSPCLISLDSTLNVVDTKVFKSITTASNILFTTLNPEQFALGYYSAKSLGNQEEQTEIKILNQDLDELDHLTYGSRTRIKDMITLDHLSFITLNYERATQVMSIKHFDRLAEKLNVIVREGEETNIPVAIVKQGKNHFAASGIANGFHYLDGHNYEQSFSYGFIKQYDYLGRETNQFTYKQTGHVFFDDMIALDESIFVIGSKQSDDTGRDAFILRLDNQLNLEWKKTITSVGIQQVSKVLNIENSLFVIGTSENIESHKMNLIIMRIDKQGNVIWQQGVGKEEHSYTAIDLDYFNSKLVVLSESKENRISDSSIYLHQFSLSGELIKEIVLN